MKIENIISELHKRNVIPAKPTGCEKLSGGTVSELYLLTVEGRKYVLKLNDPEVTQSEALYLEAYKEIKLTPKLLYVDPSFTYIVYSFIDGSTVLKGADKGEVLKGLAEGLLNQYQFAQPQSGWGWADAPSASWQDFFRNEIKEAQNVIGSRMEEAGHQLAAELVEKVGNDATPYLLHGDCGFHNFIFTEQGLAGVIDPAPVIGDPLYDFVYAFCSSADDLTKDTFDSAILYLKAAKDKEEAALYGNLLIGLYLRIASCSKHHPADLPLYFAAWSEWQKELAAAVSDSRHFQ